MRDAVLAGMTLNIFNNRCDRVRMANLAQTVNVLQAVILTDSVADAAHPDVSMSWRCTSRTTTRHYCRSRSTVR